MLNNNHSKPELRYANPTNPIGLRLQFQLSESTTQTEFILDESHQGQPGYVHEGIIALLMDEGMGWISRYAAGVKSVTAKLEIEFQHPALIGEPLVMTTRIMKYNPRLIEIQTWVEYRTGQLIASGRCVQYVMEHDPHTGGSPEGRL